MKKDKGTSIETYLFNTIDFNGYRNDCYEITECLFYRKHS